jgi:hypothetical protein
MKKLGDKGFFGSRQQFENWPSTKDGVVSA